MIQLWSSIFPKFHVRTCLHHFHLHETSWKLALDHRQGLSDARLTEFQRVWDPRVVTWLCIKGLSWVKLQQALEVAFFFLQQTFSMTLFSSRLSRKLRQGLENAFVFFTTNFHVHVFFWKKKHLFWVQLFSNKNNSVTLSFVPKTESFKKHESSFFFG